MGLLDFLLNLAALLLWLSWRGIGAEQAGGPAGTLLSNLRPANRSGTARHGYLLGLVGLLFGRAIVYRQFGPALNWHPSWSPGAVSMVFRSDHFPRMLATSGLGFAWGLYGLFASSCLVAALHRPPADKDGLTREIRRRLGWLATWPPVLLLALPLILLAAAWGPLGYLAARAGLVPALRNPAHLAEQCLVVGLGAVLVWRWLLTGVLILYFINSYVFFGASPVWDFVQQTGAKLCRPVAWVRLGQVQIGPLILLALTWGTVGLLGTGFPGLKRSLPGLPQWLEHGVLPYLYRNLPW